MITSATNLGLSGLPLHCPVCGVKILPYYQGEPLVVDSDGRVYCREHGVQIEPTYPEVYARFKEEVRKSRSAAIDALEEETRARARPRPQRRIPRQRIDPTTKLSLPQQVCLYTLATCDHMMFWGGRYKPPLERLIALQLAKLRLAKNGSDNKTIVITAAGRTVHERLLKEANGYPSKKGKYLAKVNAARLRGEPPRINPMRLCDDCGVKKTQ